MLASVRRPISTGGLYDGINPVVPYFDDLSEGLNPKINDADLDGDGLNDYAEFVNCIDPSSSDTDSDDIPDEVIP